MSPSDIDKRAIDTLNLIATPILRTTGSITKKQCEIILKNHKLLRYAPQHGKMQVVGAPISKYLNIMVEQNSDIENYRYKGFKNGRVFGPRRRGIAVVEQ